MTPAAPASTLFTPTPFTPTQGGVLVAVHLQPRASKPGIGPVTVDGLGACVVKARVAAPPADGLANAALCDLLAKQWGVPKSKVRVERGETSRHKTVRIEGEPDALLTTLAAWAEAHRD